MLTDIQTGIPKPLVLVTDLGFMYPDAVPLAIFLSKFSLVDAHWNVVLLFTVAEAATVPPLLMQFSEFGCRIPLFELIREGNTPPAAFSETADVVFLPRHTEFEVPELNLLPEDTDHFKLLDQMQYFANESLESFSFAALTKNLT